MRGQRNDGTTRASSPAGADCQAGVGTDALVAISTCSPAAALPAPHRSHHFRHSVSQIVQSRAGHIRVCGVNMQRGLGLARSLAPQLQGSDPRVQGCKAAFSEVTLFCCGSLMIFCSAFFTTSRTRGFPSCTAGTLSLCPGNMACACHDSMHPCTRMWDAHRHTRSGACACTAIS